MEDESSCDRNKTLSAEEYHNKIRRYLKDKKSQNIWHVESSTNNNN